MKKTLILLLACCACIRSQAQTPEAAAAPEPSVTRTDSTLTFPEPEFIGQALAIRPDMLSAIEFTGTKKAPSMGAGNKENYKQYLL